MKMLLMKLQKKKRKRRILWLLFCLDYLWTPNEILPKHDEGNENKNNPHLLMQFIDVLIKYWESGGGLFILAEGVILHYQLDLFLQRTNFKNYGKVKFKIEDEHEGGGYLNGVSDNEFNLKTMEFLIKDYKDIM